MCAARVRLELFTRESTQGESQSSLGLTHEGDLHSFVPHPILAHTSSLAGCLAQAWRA